ncbi:MAG: hypothetical protein WCI74_11430 [Actinomycetes bacterium]
MGDKSVIPIGDSRRGVTVEPDGRPDEVLRDADANVLDDAYADQAAADVDAYVAKNRGGRPSLGGQEGSSPLIQFRVTSEQRAAIVQAARRSGVRPSEWLRAVVEQALHEVS